MADDEFWMRLALKEADRCVAHGDVPVGAILVSTEGTEMARGRNQRELRNDPTAHAEIETLRAAAEGRSNWRLDGTTLYVTLEPCAMCAGALVNARISRLVFAAPDPKAGAIQSMFGIGTDTRLNHRFEVLGGICAEEGAQRLRAFFAKLRSEGQK